MSEPERCPECLSTRLSWGHYPFVSSGVTDGRLRASEVTTEFYLGCDECSETVLTRVHPDEVAAALTEAGWRPRDFQKVRE